MILFLGIKLKALIAKALAIAMVAKVNRLDNSGHSNTFRPKIAQMSIKILAPTPISEVKVSVFFMFIKTPFLYAKYNKFFVIIFAYF